MIDEAPALESAVILLADLCRLGVELATEGDRLRYRPREAVAPALVEALKANKPALLAILAARQAGQLSVAAEQWPEDWRERWCERSAVMEYDGGLSRQVAEDRAFLELQAYISGHWRPYLQFAHVRAYTGVMSKLREAMRQAVEASDRTRYQLSKETGIDQSQLSRLMSGQPGLGLDNLERLAEALGLEIVVRKRRKGR